MIKRGKKTNPLGGRGESMLFAVLLLLVFLSVGVSVMTAGAGTAAAVNARASERQCYFLARSVLDALDTSLQTGDIGKKLREAVRADVLAQDGAVSVDQTVALGVSSDFSALSGMTVTEARLALKGAGSVVARDVGGTPTQVLVSFDRAELSFTVNWNTKSYNAAVVYSYLGWATHDTVADTWGWNGTWRVLTFD